MSKNDVEMDDAEKLLSDSGNKLQESECKAVDPKVDDSGNNFQESKCEVIDPKVDDSRNLVQESECKLMDPKVELEEEVPRATASVGNLNGSHQCGEDLNSCRDKDKDEMNVTTEVNDQTDPVDESSEPIEGSGCGRLFIKSENKEITNAEVETEAQTAATSAVKIQSDIKDEVVEPEAMNSLVEEDGSTKNDVMGQNHGEDVERPNEDILEKKPKEIGNDTENTEHVAGKEMVENTDFVSVPTENMLLPTEFSANEDPRGQDADLDDTRPGEDEEMQDAVHSDQDKMARVEEQGVKTLLVDHEINGNDKTSETVVKPNAEESSAVNQHEAATPFVRSSAKAANHLGETSMVVSPHLTLPLMGEDDDGTPEDQAAFMKELDNFYRERAMDFKPPKFYGQPLNCLKLWKAVIRLGGYDRVTGSKLWRQVGESFHPPKTCTTVSWTFRIFYEKSLLEYERHKTQSGELHLPIPMLPEVSGGDVEGNDHQGSGPGSGLGSGRARRDAASRAMQGWHVQRLVTGEDGDPVVKDKNLNNMAKNEKNLKSIGSLKQKRPNEVEHSNKVARTDISKQLVTSVVDVGSPADWVKINVRQTKECFEVYALVPGLLREEVRVQSDPAGRLVITGQPEQIDNPWGITPFKKIISLPARIDPVQTSAVVSLHGRLLVRVPFEQPNI